MFNRNVPSAAWHSTNTVVARGIPPYDATVDASCGTFVYTTTFRAHWREMQRTLTTPATPNNKPRPVAASDLALPQIHEAVRLAFSPRKPTQPTQPIQPKDKIEEYTGLLTLVYSPQKEKFNVLRRPKRAGHFLAVLKC